MEIKETIEVFKQFNRSLKDELELKEFRQVFEQFNAELKFNPNHVASGATGGQFTTGKNSATKDTIENDSKFTFRKKILELSGALGKHDLEDYEAVAISGYMGSEYGEMNSFLRGESEATDRVKAYIDATKTGLAKLPDYEGKAFRSTDLTSKQIKVYENALKNKTSVKHEYFTSSTKLSGNEFPGNTKFIIHSKSGKSVAFLSKIGKNEDEILFTTGAKFNVSDITKDGSTTFIHLNQP